MNRAVRRISIAVLVMFVLLLANVNYLQAFEANSLSGKKGNSRAFTAQFQNKRGEITTADGTVLAEDHGSRSAIASRTRWVTSSRSPDASTRRTRSDSSAAIKRNAVSTLW